jgi:WD40 repeat protein
VYDLDRDGRRTDLSGHEGAVTALATDPTGSQLISVGADATVRAWHVQDAAPIAALRVTEPLFDCCWLRGGCGVCLAGKGGVYFLELLPGTKASRPPNPERGTCSDKRQTKDLRWRRAAPGGPCR